MKILNVFAAMLLGAVPMAGAAQDACTIDIAVANVSKGDVVPEAVNSKLEAKLAQAISKAGFSSAPYDARFFIAGRFDDAFNDISGGTSQKVFVKTNLTLYIGDAEEQKIFATESFELSGVGSSDQQAYTRALGKLSATNQQLLKFITEGRQKIIDYYDANYQTYIDKARQAMSARKFDEALYYLAPIPDCCKGYAEARDLSMQVWNDRMNLEAQQLLSQAKGEWAADPTATGAAKAYAHLSKIDPAADCYAEATALGESMSKTTQKQWEFENVTKYKDAQAMEKRRIDAVKEIAVTYAKNQPKVINRYTFIPYRYY
ncbi:MAG: hypothetical protein K2L05_05345 [Muribaculaceae bacterium]|nr:hypothetical protein [Muribaculaceae bacterium]